MRGIARTHRFGIGDEEARVSVRGEARVDPVLVPVRCLTSANRRSSVARTVDSDVIDLYTLLQMPPGDTLPDASDPEAYPPLPPPSRPAPTSQHKGVYWIKARRKWMAKITRRICDGNQVHIL